MAVGEIDHDVEHVALDQADDAAQDAAFEAAFNDTRGEEPHAEGSTSDKEAAGKALTTDDQDDEQAPEDAAAAEAAAQAAAQADAEAKAKAEAEAPVTLTKAELDALRAAAAAIPQLQADLTKTRDSTAGKIGSLQQLVETVRAQAEKGQRPNFKQMKRLAEEFPEFAAVFTADMEDAYGAAGTDAPNPGAEAAANDGKASGEQAPGATPPAEPADPFSDPKVQQHLRNQEMAIVDARHPDWRSLSATPEFKEWNKSLPQAAQQLLASTWDSKTMTAAFTDFKGWKQKREAATAAGKQRDTRLAHAVPATNGQQTGANAVDEDAAFLTGFKQVRG